MLHVSIQQITYEALLSHFEAIEAYILASTQKYYSYRNRYELHIKMNNEQTFRISTSQPSNR